MQDIEKLLLADDDLAARIYQYDVNFRGICCSQYLTRT